MTGKRGLAHVYFTRGASARAVVSKGRIHVGKTLCNVNDSVPRLLPLPAHEYVSEAEFDRALATAKATAARERK